MREPAHSNERPRHSYERGPHSNERTTHSYERGPHSNERPTHPNESPPHPNETPPHPKTTPYPNQLTAGLPPTPFSSISRILLKAGFVHPGGEQTVPQIHALPLLVLHLIQQFYPTKKVLHLYCG